MADTKHRQIADELRSEINHGDLSPGAQLPSEAELRTRFGVSRITVRTALTTLANEGLITSGQGRGWYVQKPTHLLYRPQEEFRPHPVTSELDSFMSTRTQEGRIPSQTIEVSIIAAPTQVAQRLNLDEGEPVVVRRRLRCLDGHPSHTNDSYYPLDLVSGSEIMQPADIGRGAMQVMTELGYEQIRALDEIHVRMPTPDEVHRLQIGPGTPVAIHIVTSFTADHRPVRVVRNVLPGDRHTIVWERERTPKEEATSANAPAGQA